MASWRARLDYSALRASPLRGRPSGVSRRCPSDIWPPAPAGFEWPRGAPDWITRRYAPRPCGAALRAFPGVVPATFGRSRLLDLNGLVARPTGFEPVTFGFGGRHSIQLSYGRMRGVAILPRSGRAAQTGGRRHLEAVWTLRMEHLLESRHQSPSGTSKKSTTPVSSEYSAPTTNKPSLCTSCSMISDPCRRWFTDAWMLARTAWSTRPSRS